MTNVLTLVQIFVTLYDFWEHHIGHNAECHKNLDQPCGLAVKLYQLNISVAEVQFSPVLPPFFENREPN